MVWGSNATSVGIAVAKNMVNVLTTAVLDVAGTGMTVTAGGDVTVTADEVAEISADITLAVLAQSVNDPTLLVAGLIEAALLDYTHTSNSGTVDLQTGETVRVADDYAECADDCTGTVFEYTGTDAAGVGLDLGAVDYSTGPWKRLLVDTIWEIPFIDRVLQFVQTLETVSTAGGGLVALNDVRGSVTAAILGVDVDAGGALTVAANERAAITAIITSSMIASGGTGSAAFGVVIATNLVLSSAHATVSDAALIAGGALTVAAANTSAIIATISAVTETAGVGIGITLAFNTIGWGSQNIFFNIADAVAGTDIGTQIPAETVASVTGSTIDAGGSVAVTATGASSVVAHIRNAIVSVNIDVPTGGEGGGNATSLVIGAVIAMNKVNAVTRAEILSAPVVDAAPSVSAGGDLTVTADDSASIDAWVEAPVTAVTIGLTDGQTASIGVGLSLARNDIRTKTDAQILNVPLARAAGAVTVGSTGASVIHATSAASAITVALGIKGAAAFSGGGAVAINLIQGRTNATVDRSRIDATAGDLTLTADFSSEITAVVAAISVAVGVGLQTSAAIAIGIAVARNLIGWEQYANPTTFDVTGSAMPIEVKARAMDADLHAGEDVILRASNTSTIIATISATSVAVGASPQSALAVAIGGVWADNMIGARVEASATRTAVHAGTRLEVTASDTSTITADAQGVSVAASLAGQGGVSGSVGMSLAHNTIDSQVLAILYSPGVVVAPGGIHISATNEAEILVKAIAVAVSVSVAGGSTAIALAGGGAESTNRILATTRAGVVGGSLGTLADPVSEVVIDAKSTGSIHALVLGIAGSIAAGGGTSIGLALGISVARNLIGWDETASVTTTYTSDQTAPALQAGDTVRVVGGVLDGEAFSYRGPPITHSVVLSSVDYTDPSVWERIGLTPSAAATEAVISGADVYSTGAVSLSATSSQTIEALVIAAAVAIAGGATAGAGLAGAGSYAENRINASTRAAIDGGSPTSPHTIRAGSLTVIADDTVVDARRRGRRRRLGELRRNRRHLDRHRPLDRVQPHPRGCRGSRDLGHREHHGRGSGDHRDVARLRALRSRGGRRGRPRRCIAERRGRHLRPVG